MTIAKAALGAALLGIAQVGYASAAPPFVGKWGGGPTDCRAPFVLTETTYTPPGSKTLRIAAIERHGSDYLISFPDGYRISLFDVGKRTMTWHSPMSGDTFDLERCK